MKAAKTCGYADPGRNFGRVLDAKQAIRGIFDAARRHRWGWQHSETIERAVIPILRLLNYPDDEIRQTTQGLDGSRHRADIDIRNPFRTSAVIEVKKWGTPLCRTEHYPGVYTPLDQILFYYDGSPAKTCLLTNGVEWWLVRRARSEFAIRGVDYVAVRFRLDEAVMSNDGHLGTFLGLFDYQSIAGPEPGAGGHLSMGARGQTES